MMLAQVGFMDEMDSLGLVIVKQLSLQLFGALESREPIVFIVPLSHPLGTVFSLWPRQVF